MGIAMPIIRELATKCPGVKMGLAIVHVDLVYTDIHVTNGLPAHCWNRVTILVLIFTVILQSVEDLSHVTATQLQQQSDLIIICTYQRYRSWNLDIHFQTFKQLKYMFRTWSLSLRWGLEGYPQYFHIHMIHIRWGHALWHGGWFMGTIVSIYGPSLAHIMWAKLWMLTGLLTPQFCITKLVFFSSCDRNMPLYQNTFMFVS